MSASTTPVEEVSCVCGVTAIPFMSMNERMQLVPSCPSCGREHRAPQPQQPALTVVAPAKAQVIPLRREEPIPDPVLLIQKRLAFLDEEIAKTTAYNAERCRLRKMLKAAGVTS